MLNAIDNIAAENCFDVAALSTFIVYEGIAPEDVVEAFQDAYAGTWDSVEAWAENFMEDTGYQSEMPEGLRLYFDFSAWARDAPFPAISGLTKPKPERWCFGIDSQQGSRAEKPLGTLTKFFSAIIDTEKI